MNEIKKSQSEKLALPEVVYNLISLSKFPYFARISKHDKRRSVEYKGQEGGWVVEWKVTTPTILPGEIEWKVWVWILDKIRQEMQKTQDVPKMIIYSIYEIKQYWQKKGVWLKDKDIKNALFNLQKTSIYFEVFSEENIQEKFYLGFSLLESIKGKQQKKRGVQAQDIGAIWLSDRTIEMFLKKQIKPNDLTRWIEIGKENFTASRVYELLSIYATTEKDIIILDYEDLINKLGLKKEEHLSLIKKQFKKVEQILQKHKIIEKMEIDLVRDVKIPSVMDYLEMTREEVQKKKKEENRTFYRIKFYIGEALKQEIKTNKNNILHKQLTEKAKNGEKLDENNINKEVNYWIEEFNRKLNIPVENYKYFIRHIITKNPDYNQIFQKLILECLQYNPENRLEEFKAKLMIFIT